MQRGFSLNRIIVLGLLLGPGLALAQNDATAYFERTEVTISNTATCAGLPDRSATQPLQQYTTPQATIQIQSGDVACPGTAIAGAVTFQAVTTQATARGATTFETIAPLSVQMTQQTTFTRTSTATAAYSGQIAVNFPSPECRFRSDDNLNPAGGLPVGATVSQGNGGCDFTSLGLPFLAVEHQRYVRIQNTLTASLVSTLPQNSVQVRVTIAVVYRISFPLLRLTPNPLTVTIPAQSSTPVTARVTLENIGGHPLTWQVPPTGSATLQVTPETGLALRPGESTQLTVSVVFSRPSGEYTVGFVTIPTNQASSTADWRAPTQVLDVRAVVGSATPSTVELSAANPAAGTPLDPEKDIEFSAMVGYSHTRETATAIALEVLDQAARRVSSSNAVTVPAGTSSQRLTIPAFRVSAQTTRLTLRGLIVDGATGNVLSASAPPLEYPVALPPRVELTQVIGEQGLADRQIIPVNETPLSRDHPDYRAPDRITFRSSYFLPGVRPGTQLLSAAPRDFSGRQTGAAVPLSDPAPVSIAPGDGTLQADLVPQVHSNHAQLDWQAVIRSADGREVRSKTIEHLFEWVQLRHCGDSPMLDPGERELECEIRLNVRRDSVQLGYRALSKLGSSDLKVLETLPSGTNGVKLVKLPLTVPDAAEGPVRVQFFLEGEAQALGSMRAWSAEVALPVRTRPVQLSAIGDVLQGPGAQIRALANTPAQAVQVTRSTRTLGFGASDMRVFGRSSKQAPIRTETGTVEAIDLTKEYLTVGGAWVVEPPIAASTGFAADVQLQYEASDLPPHPEFDATRLKVYSFDPDTGDYREYESIVDTANRRVTARVTGLSNVFALAMPGPFRKKLSGVAAAASGTALLIANVASTAEEVRAAGLGPVGGTVNPFPESAEASVLSSVAVSAQEAVAASQLFQVSKPAGGAESAWIAGFGAPATLALSAAGTGAPPLRFSGVAREFLLPGVAWDFAAAALTGFAPELHLANPNELETEVRLEFHDANGALAGQSDFRLAPWSKRSSPLHLELNAPPAAFSGWIRVTSTHGVFAAVRTAPSAGYVPAGPPTLTSGGVRTWVAPYFQTGPESRTTRLALLNTASAPMLITVRAYSDLGALIASGQGVLGPGEQVIREVGQIVPLDSRILSVGSLRVETDIAGLSGLVSVDNFQVRPLDPVLQTENPARFAAQFPAQPGIDMGAAEFSFVNPGIAPVTVSARAYNTAGTPLGSAAQTRSIAQGGRWNGSLSSLLPETGRRETGGYVLFDSPKPLIGSAFLTSSTSGTRDLPMASLQGISTPDPPPPPPQTDLIFNPPSLDFGGVTRGQSLTRSVSVRNPAATSAVTITGVSFSDTQFRWVAPAFPFTIAAGATTAIEVSFNPAPGAQAQAVSANLTLSNGQRLNLTGAIVISETPRVRIEVTPPGLDFGNVQSGTTKEMTISVRSTGTEPLIVTGVTITGSTRFSIQFVSFPLTLGPLVGQNLQVRFSPAIAGTQLGTLAIATNDPANPNLAINLVGTGIGVAAAPRIETTVTSLEFGIVNLNETVERTFEIRNRGTAPLVVQSMTIDNAFYTIGPPAPFTVAAGAIADVGVVFRPRQMAGPQNATLKIVSNDAVNGNISIPITGASQ